jgi:hypothetical protein
LRKGWKDPYPGMSVEEVLDELRGPVHLPGDPS